MVIPPKPKPTRALPKLEVTPTQRRSKLVPTPTKPKPEVTRKPMLNLGKVWDGIFELHPLEFRLTLIRPDDLVVCDFILENLKPVLEDGVPKLVREHPNTLATIIMELPPQSFGEQAFLDATGPEVSNVPPGEKFPESSSVKDKNVPVSDAEVHGALPFAKIRMAGRSRIAFIMPADVLSVDLTAEAVLDACRRWKMRLDVNAVPEPGRSFGDLLVEGTHFNKAWLAGLVQSEAWSSASDTLSSALGDPSLTQALEKAASRLAKQSVKAINAGKTAGLADALQASMLSELVTLGKEYPKLHESANRDLGLAFLSLQASRAFAEGGINKFEIGLIENLPFLPILLYPHRPAKSVTALELPYRLIVSPVPPSSWWHATKPVEHNGRTELWHTRLTQPSKGIGPDSSTNLRAIWSDDYEFSDQEINDIVNGEKPFLMSLDALDRQMLVKLMAGFDEEDDDGNTFVPHTARSKRLMLSALGALLDAEGNWDTNLPTGVSLEQWKHLATLGRDAYVRVVYRGYLMPFGHSASLIKVTERKFEDQGEPNTGRVAILRQRFFIVVREKIKEYSGAGHQFQGRNFPFRSVEILTHTTPNLKAPKDSKLDDPNGKIYTGPKSIPNRACFWPIVQGQDFMFQMAATDIAGERATFAMPLLFVGVEVNKPGKEATLVEIRARYNDKNNNKNKQRRTTFYGNAPICYAENQAGAEGDTRLPTANLTFTAAGLQGISRSKVQFYPEIESAMVGIAAIQRLLQQPNAVVPVAYPEVYKQSGFAGPNAGEVFLKTLEVYGLDFGDQVKTDSMGGLASPSMAIQGLSRKMGPVAAQPPANPDDIENALGNIINDTFNPADFFKGAKILGGIELADLLEVAATLIGADVPKLLSKQLPDKLEARFDWNTVIKKSDPLGLFIHSPAGTQTKLEMHGVISSPIANPAATTFTANASLMNFKVNLFGFIIIWFDNLEFKSGSGSKADVSVNMHPGEEAIVFGGPLEFVNTLRQIIPSNGFSDPPNISITPSGISAGYSLGLPSLSVGIFSLENVSLGAGFSLPFDSKPANVRFNFCERQSPFSLTVSFLGGGGFFAIGISTKGLDEIEAALEFGAGISINLGVASGGVEIKAGVYFHWMSESIELTGYIRLHGELSILGLISASLTFNLQLTYLKENQHSVLWGEATLTIEVEILFFSFDVSVTCRREFGGSDADPKFLQMIPDQPTWTYYCEAFAEEV